MATVLWATFLLVVGVALFNVWRCWGMEEDLNDIMQGAREMQEYHNELQANEMRCLRDAANPTPRPQTPHEAQAHQEVRQFTRDTNPDLQQWIDAYLNTPEGRQETMQAVYQMMGRQMHETLTRAIDRDVDRAWQNAYAQTPAQAQQMYDANPGVYQAAWNHLGYPNPFAVSAETEEQRVARELREQQERERQEEANRRARGLLQEKLTPEQWADWETTRSFVATSQSGKQYRLGDARSFNVTLLGSPIRQTFCAVPTGSYNFPIEDQLLAQKLWLETNEQQFLDTANWSPSRPGRTTTMFGPNAAAAMLGGMIPRVAFGFDDRIVVNYQERTDHRWVLHTPTGQDAIPTPPNRQMRRAMAPVCLELGCTFRIVEDARRFSYVATHLSPDGEACEAQVRNTYDEQHTVALRPVFTNLARTAHGRTE